MTTTNLTTIGLRPLPPSTSHPPRSPPANTRSNVLPAPITSSTHSHDPSIPGLGTRLFLRVFKLTLATLATFLTLISGWWTLDLAMYQASASFQQTCLQQMQTLNATVGEACHEVVRQALEKPRTWREYFAKGAQVIKRGMENIDQLLPSRRWQNIEDFEDEPVHDEVVDTIEEEPESTEDVLARETLEACTRRRGRFWRCHQQSPYSGRPKPPIDYVCWAAFAEHRPKLEDRKVSDVVDWHDVEVDHECIRMQGDASVMYGGMPSYDLLGSIAYENVSTLSCERYGSFVGEQLGGLYGWDGSLGSDTLALWRAQMTRVLFHQLHDPQQWRYLSWPRLVWNTTGWAVEDMRVVEGLAVTLIVTMVGYIMMRRKTAC